MDEKLESRPVSPEKEREIELVVGGNRDYGAAEIAPVPANLLDKYEHVVHVATGGMASVYRGKHRLTGQNVAIKVLADRRDQSVERFKREAATVAALTHGNIVHIYDFGVDGAAYITMEYVEGRSLSEAVQAEGRLSLERFYKVFADVCAGLAHAHRKGVVHRDIKPSNILIQEVAAGEETAKLADFGLAKALVGGPGQEISQTGEILGTPLYMSPEQCMGATAGKPSDIYSLGCVMYECLTGQPPIKGANFLETVWYRLNEKPKSFAELGVKAPSALERVVFRCLAQDPADRYQSVEALAADLECCRLNKAISQTALISGRPGKPQSFKKKRSERNGALLAVSVALAIMTVCAAFLAANLAYHGPDTPSELEGRDIPAPPVPLAPPVPRAPRAVHKLPPLASKLFLMVDLQQGAAGQKSDVMAFHNQGDGVSDADYAKLMSNSQVKLETQQWGEYYQKIFDEMRPADGSIPKGARMEMNVAISGDGQVFANTKWADAGDQRVQQFYNEVLMQAKSLSKQPWIKPPAGYKAVEFSYWVEGDPLELRLSVNNLKLVPDQQ
jgi:serine/threonine protein kinase